MSKFYFVFDQILFTFLAILHNYYLQIGHCVTENLHNNRSNVIISILYHLIVV